MDGLMLYGLFVLAHLKRIVYSGELTHCFSSCF